MTDLTPQQLRKAADLKEKIDSLQEQLSQILGISVPEESPTSRAHGTRRKRKMSAAGRAAIAAAARARWAKIRGDKASTPLNQKPKKRKMSAAGRAAIAAAARARWAKARAAGRSTL